MDKKKFIALMVMLTSSMRPVSGDPQQGTTFIPGTAGVELKLAISAGTPPSASLRESMPLILKFEFRQSVTRPPGCAVTAVPAYPYRLPLYEISYAVHDDTGRAFLTDRIDLYGNHGPGSLKVRPGINLPLGSKKVKISAELHYSKLKFDSACGTFPQDHAVSKASMTADVSVSPKPVHRYFHIRDGYIRRHLLDSGRHLSWVWLKEYEPGKDRKELLFHSRVFKAPGDHTRVYVPWIRKCDDGSCGNSVTQYAQTIYGAHENPLLRGGLAMATFSLEYLSEKNAPSLRYALKLLDYFERSEWIDPSGAHTGFFLRSRYPGNKHGETKQQYFYASIDEIIGMTLGLLYLDKALEQAGDAVNQKRLEDLVDRLGTQLKENYYFIVPYRRVVTDGKVEWISIGLPEERHKGWSGGYFLQWFLAGGFRAITGKNYRPPDPQLHSAFSIHLFWAQVYNGLQWKGGEKDDIGDIRKALLLGTPPTERALAVIQAAGVIMYHQGTLYRVPIPCWFDQTIKLKSNLFERFNFAMLLHAFQLGMADEANRDPDFVHKLKTEMARLIAGILMDGTYTTVNLKKALVNRGSWPLGALVEIFGVICDFDVTEQVGTPVPEDDYYAAAVASLYDLPAFFSVPPGEITNDHLKAIFTSRIKSAADATSNAFTWALPAGERQACAGGQNDGKECSDNGGCPGGQCARVGSGIDHNPELKIGQAFVWEKAPGNNTKCGTRTILLPPPLGTQEAPIFCWKNWPRSRVQGGGKEPGSGLLNDRIRELYARGQMVRTLGYDAMYEGAGIGFLLPAILLHRSKGWYAQLNSSNFKAYDSAPILYLPACFTEPRLLARVEEGLQPLQGQGRCNFSFPAIPPDPYEAVCTTGDQVGQTCAADVQCGDGGTCGNDFYTAPTELTWGNYTNLSIDRVTHSVYKNNGMFKEYNSYDGIHSVIDPEGDRDYYAVKNPQNREMSVVLSETSRRVKISVDTRSLAAKMLNPIAATIPGFQFTIDFRRDVRSRRGGLIGPAGGSDFAINMEVRREANGIVLHANSRKVNEMQLKPRGFVFTLNPADFPNLPFSALGYGTPVSIDVEFLTAQLKGSVDGAPIQTKSWVPSTGAVSVNSSASVPGRDIHMVGITGRQMGTYSLDIQSVPAR